MTLFCLSITGVSFTVFEHSQVAGQMGAAGLAKVFCQKTFPCICVQCEHRVVGAKQENQILCALGSAHAFGHQRRGKRRKNDAFGWRA